MPAPNTAHVEPGWTLAVFSAAPSPVDSPHANRHARSSGASGETLAKAISGITVASANVEVPMKWRISSPFRERRGGSFRGDPRVFFSRVGRDQVGGGGKEGAPPPGPGGEKGAPRAPGAR